MKKRKFNGMTQKLCLLIAFCLTALTVNGLRADEIPAGQQEKEFTVVTWNIHMDWSVHETENTSRHKTNAWKMSELTPEILGAQEDFFKAFHDGMPYYYVYASSVRPNNADSLHIYGNGLTTFSDIPIQPGTYKIDWNDCSSTEQLDCESRKGFTFSKIPMFEGATEAGTIHFYNLHLDAGRSASDMDTRNNQIHQLSAYMDNHSKGYPVIVVGDFNLQGIPGKEGAPFDMSLMNLFRDMQNLNMANNTRVATTPDGSKLDYILFRSGSVGPNNLEKICSEILSVGGSDHWPVKADLRYVITFDEFPDLKVTNLLFNQDPYGMWRASVTVKNRGPGNTPEGIPVRIDIQIKGDKNTSEFGYIPELAVNQSSTIEIGLDDYTPPEGYFTVIATADSRDEIMEIKGNNNIMQKVFSNGELPSSPVLIAPADNATICTLTPKLRWNPVTAAPAVDAYQLVIKDSSTNVVVFNSGNITNTFMVVPNGILQRNSTYSWHVRCHNALGWGNWKGRTIRTGLIGAPAKPVLISPANSTTVFTKMPKLKWQALTACPDVDCYQVQINDSNGNKLYLSGNLTSVSLTVPAGLFQYGKTYYWYVRAHNSFGWGKWNGRNLSVCTLTVPEAPFPILPAGGATISTTTPLMKWSVPSACPPVDYYQIRIFLTNDSDGFSYSNINSTSFSVPANNLQIGKDYKWSVRAHNTQGWGAWCSWKTFRIRLQ